MGFFKDKTVIITGGGRAVLSDGSCGSIGYGIATAYAMKSNTIMPANPTWTTLPGIDPSGAIQLP